MYKEIIERAERNRGVYDHIGWKGICRRCGLSHNYFVEDIRKLWDDVHVDLRRKNLHCKSPRCNGEVKILYKMSGERAVHLHDIMRRN